MSHAVETMMYANKMPWHGLGTYVGEEDVDTATAIREADMDWTVSKEGIYTRDNELIPEYYALTRSTDKRVFGMVKDRYVPLQNQEAFSWFDEISMTGKARIHTAGSLHNGATVWILAQVEGNINVADGDDIAKYLLIHTDHSGKGSVNIKFTPVRVVCSNTLNAALQSSDSLHVRIRHMGDVQGKLTEAKRIIGVIDEKFDAVAEAYGILAETERDVMAEYFEPFVGGLFDISPKNSVRLLDNIQREKLENNEKASDMIQHLSKIYNHSNTLNNPAIESTLWKGYNAITEYFDHEAPYTPTEGERRMNSLIFGAKSRQKEHAFTLAMKSAQL